MKKLLTLSIALLSLNLYGAEPSVWPWDAAEEKAAKKAFESDGNFSSAGESSTNAGEPDRTGLGRLRSVLEAWELELDGVDGNSSRLTREEIGEERLRGLRRQGNRTGLGRPRRPYPTPWKLDYYGNPRVPGQAYNAAGKRVDYRGRVLHGATGRGGWFGLMLLLFFIIIAVKVFSSTK
jgi:hypothetical protein